MLLRNLQIFSKRLMIAAAGLVSFLHVCANPPSATSFKFDFGAGKVAKGYTQVLPATAYAAETGYGFDFGSVVTAVDFKSKDPLKADAVAAVKPFYFSVKLPEGNYKITVTMGSMTEKTNTTIKAESRRLMVENLATEAGSFVNKTFIVNIKDRRIDEKTNVSLKDRELGKLDWDDKLTLEFDLYPVLAALEIEKVDDQVTVYLAGNSTVVNQDDEPWAAWGQMIPLFFNPGIAISNHAESGLTLGSFLGSKRLQKIMSVIKPGDYLFIEFGHNDQKEKGPNDGAWKSYTERFKQFIKEARAKNAVPVIVTSTARRSFDSAGHSVNTLGDYPDAARKVAADEGVALIDLNKMTMSFYDAMGVEPSKKAFVFYPANTYPGQKEELHDNTHFNPYGAYELAKCIVEGIKANKLGIAKFLRTDMVAFDPKHPDLLASFNWPESPKSTVVKPDGN